MTKVLYSMIYPPERGGSGAPVYTDLLLRHMARAGEAPGILSTTHLDYEPAPDLPYRVHPVRFERPAIFDSQPSVSNSVPFAALTPDEVASHKEALRLAYREAIDINGYELIHVQHGMYLGAIAAETKVPYIVSLHIMELNFLEEFPDPIDAFIALACAARILALTEAQKQRVLDEYAPERIVELHAKHKNLEPHEARVQFDDQTRGARIVSASFEICPLGIDMNRYNTNVDTDGPWADVVLPGDQVVLFAARLIELKGIHTLIEAESRYAREGIHTLIAGGGLLEPMVREVEANRPRFNYLGFLSQEEMPGLLSFVASKSGVLANPTRSEGLSVVYLEAMASGVPIVASAKHDMGELDFMQQPNVRFAPFEDHETVAQAILNTLADPPAPSLVRSAVSGYGADRFCLKVESSYRDCLGHLASPEEGDGSAQSLV